LDCLPGCPGYLYKCSPKHSKGADIQLIKPNKFTGKRINREGKKEKNLFLAIRVLKGKGSRNTPLFNP